MHVITITDTQRKTNVTPELFTLVRLACEASLYSEGFMKPTDISVTFVGKNRIRALNAEYRGRDKVTDVLSFPLCESGEGFTAAPNGRVMLGDIVICPEAALAQSVEYGHSFEREIAFLTVHGTLHLLGYDHETGDREESVMFAKQKNILETLGVSR